MAQVVARFHGMEEATGSNPVSSTRCSMFQPCPVPCFGCRAGLGVGSDVGEGGAYLASVPSEKDLMRCH